MTMIILWHLTQMKCWILLLWNSHVLMHKAKDNWSANYQKSPQLSTKQRQVSLYCYSNTFIHIPDLVPNYSPCCNLLLYKSFWSSVINRVGFWQPLTMIIVGRQATLCQSSSSNLQQKQQFIDLSHQCVETHIPRYVSHLTMMKSYC